MCSLFPTTCILSFQLELRRKQFHVLLSTIHELQQTLESKCCSLVIDITGLCFSRSKGITASSRGMALCNWGWWPLALAEFFPSSSPEPETALSFFSSTSYPLCHFLTSFRLICRQQNSLKCEDGEWPFEVVVFWFFLNRKYFLPSYSCAYFRISFYNSYFSSFEHVTTAMVSFEALLKRNWNTRKINDNLLRLWICGRAGTKTVRHES